MAWAWPPRAYEAWHGLAAAAAAVAWGAVKTRGTFNLDAVYIPCAPAVWRALFVVNALAAAAAPWVLAPQPLSTAVSSAL